MYLMGTNGDLLQGVTQLFNIDPVMKAQFMKYAWKFRQFIIAKGGSRRYCFLCFWQALLIIY